MERTRRRFWTLATTAGAVLVIVAAAASGLFQVAVQSVPGYRADVEKYVREQTGQAIRIGSLGLTWRYYYPSLDLNGVALMAADGQTPLLQAERLRLGFGLTRLVRGDTTPNRLELQGLRLNAEIDRDGQLSVQGMESQVPAQGSEALEGLKALTRFSRIRLERCRLNLRDLRRSNEQYSFGIESATLERGLLGQVLSADVTLPALLGDSARFELYFTGDPLAPQTWSGTASAELTHLVLDTWLAPVLVPGARVFAPDTELRLNSRIEHGKPVSVALELNSGPIRAHRAQHAAVIESLALSGEAEQVEGGWRARLDRLEFEGEEGRWPATKAELQRTQAEGAPAAYEASFSYLRIADLAPWLEILAVPASLTSLSQASGDVRELQLRVQGSGDDARYSYRARFEQLALPPSEHPAGFAGVRGEVAGDESGGRAVLQESAVTLEFPGKLATPTIPLDALEAELEWQQREEGWKVAMPQFRWELWGLRGKGRFSLDLPADKASPVIDLAAQFSADDVTRAKPLIPQAWGAGLRSWLDRSIVAGRATRADLSIKGPLADFPFHQRPTGKWTLDIDAADVQLSYHPDWPTVDDLAAHLSFTGNTLAIESTRGTVSGNAIDSVTARFPDFSTGQLLIDGSVRGETARFYRFLEQSPLRDKFTGLLAQTTASGPSVVDIHLDIPVKEAQQTHVAGRVGLDAVELRLRSLPEPIREIRGNIDFDHAGIRADGLSAHIYEVPLAASIAPRGDGSSLLTTSFRLAIDPAGKGASSLIPAWLRKKLSGVSDWKGTLPLGGARDAPLRLATDLAGVAAQYPPPAGKAPEELRPLVLTIGSTDDAPLHITAELQDRLGADLKFARQGGTLALERGALRFGAGAPPVASDPGIVLTAELPELDAQAWWESLVSSGLEAPGQAIRHADMHVGTARWAEYSVRDARYVWTSAKDGWALVLTGTGGSGEVHWTGAGRGQLGGKFDALALDYTHGGKAPAVEDVIDPNALPVFDLDVRKLTVGKADLGHVVFATTRTATGQKTRTLKADGGSVTLTADAEWRRRAGQSSASVSGDFATTDIATLMRSFSYTPNLDAKAMRAKTALAWEPAERLEWAQGEGTVHLEFDTGQLRAVEPGAGRALGLMNFYALPRRLTLNFRDVVSSGLGFDHIAGDFELRDGNASTQNLQIAGPSLRMDLRGRIGLAARDYDQQVTVYPDVSGGVTLGALALGGPVAGALAFIAQQVLNKPLNQVSQLSYRVTGSWDNPQVERSATPAPERPAEKPGAPAPKVSK